MTPFICPITIQAEPVHGLVRLIFGPMDMGNVGDLIDFIRNSETIKESLLDNVAQTVTLRWNAEMSAVTEEPGEC